jgi:hypothetical protein
MTALLKRRVGTGIVRGAVDGDVAQLLVTVCTMAVLLVQMTMPPGFTVAAGNGALLLVMLTFTTASVALALTTTLPVIGL